MGKPLQFFFLLHSLFIVDSLTITPLKCANTSPLPLAITTNILSTTNPFPYFIPLD